MWIQSISKQIQMNMDINSEQPYIAEDSKGAVQTNMKRKCDIDATEVPLKKKAHLQSEVKEDSETNLVEDVKTNSEDSTKTNCPESDKQVNAMEVMTVRQENLQLNRHQDIASTSSRAKSLTKSPEKKVPQSPKKRLDIKCNNKQQNKTRFIYGNYSQYYGYRNRNTNNNDKDQVFHDIRLDVFQENKDIFRDKEVLDIGCNNGFITMHVAKHFDVKSIAGVDIDKQLIKKALKNLTKLKKAFPMDNDLKRHGKFPFNVTFVHGNYVLRDEVLLEIETPQFDVILCLSITKWIHLNFGDAGLKLAFKRMFLQLKAKGVLILEAQQYDNYGRRKNMTNTILENYKSMQFFPKNFDEYLLSPQVGFSKMLIMAVPDHCTKGFKRPIQLFYKE